MSIKKNKSLFLLLVIVLLGAGFIYLPYMMKQIPYEFVTIDTREENFAFYNELIQLFEMFRKTGSLPFYSWSDFLGTNFFVSKMWYIMTDIPMLFCAWFKVYFWDALILTTIFKMILASLSMYLLLGMFSFKESTKVIGSILYAFSAGMMYYSVYPIFLFSYSLFPLYLYTLEKYLQKKKWIPFCIMTFVMASVSFYYFFVISFFLPVYYIYRYYLLRENFNMFFKDTFRLIGYYLIGVCLSGVVLYPVILYLLQSSRIGHPGINFLFNDIRVYVTELAGIFLPMNLLQPVAYPFNTNNYPTREIFLWAGSISVLLLPQIFVLQEQKRKKADLIFIGIEILFLICPLLLSAMHGFSDVSFRGTILFVIVNLIMMCHVLEHVAEWNWRLLRFTCIFATVVCASIVPLTCFILKLNILEYTEALSWGTTFAVIYSIMFLLLEKRKFIWIGLLCICELIIFPTISQHYLKDGSYRHSYQFMNDATHVLQDEPGELRSFLDQIELVNTSQYYRVYIPQESVYWSMGLNSAFYYQINGLSTYDSIYEPTLRALVDQVPEIIRGSDWYLDIQQAQLMKFLNVKYAVVSNEQELPQDMNWRLITDNYRGFLSVYRNDDYRPLGTSYTQVSVLDKESSFLNNILKVAYCSENDMNFLRAAVTDEMFELENIKYSGNQLTGTVESENGGLLVLGLPFNDGWNIKLNGDTAVKYRVNESFLGVVVPSGSVFLEMYFTPPGLKQGAILSIAGFVMFVLILIFSCFKKKDRKKSSF
ncbi:YfhO family protein [Holdemania sp. 1001302B_160321_E10]|uniref:YfhO family protein n=1 Tax=Holdemania sp. 1001302B_160321_E10 TaxID=2787120 RepID=UPI00189BE9B0|nr:YfhO family protein [Holdemania sp. 1001302B_160321_E10]